MQRWYSLISYSFLFHTGGNLLCCDFCPLVFHVECLDPPLTEIPTEEWKCPQCVCFAQLPALIAQQSIGKADYVNTGQAQSEYDLCRACHTGGQLLWCDSCPNCYHLQCLAPPLDSAPVGDWFCEDCVSTSDVWPPNGHSASHTKWCGPS